MGLFACMMGLLGEISCSCVLTRQDVCCALGKKKCPGEAFEF